MVKLSDYQRLNLFPRARDIPIPAVCLHLSAAVDQLLNGALLPWLIITVAHLDAVAHTKAHLRDKERDEERKRERETS